MFNFQDNGFLLVYVSLLLLSAGCQSQTGSSSKNETNDSIEVLDSGSSKRLSCYNLQPVWKDAKYMDGDESFWPGYNQKIKFNLQSIDTFLRNEYLKGIYNFDTSLRYITSFGYQAEIIIHEDCVERLRKPDEIFLQQIYFPLQNRPLGNLILNPVTFEKEEHRKIQGFGLATIYQYRLKAADVSPHQLHIILRDLNDSERQDGFYHGIALCTDGIIWKHVDDFSVPLFVQLFPDAKLASPLFYDGKRFIPTAIFKQEL